MTGSIHYYLLNITSNKGGRYYGISESNSFKSNRNSRQTSSNISKDSSSVQSSIILVAGEKRLQAKSVLNLMSAAIKCGTEITVECDGEDEAEALKTVVEAIESGLGE